jgi:HAD superfamily hydrolase (TIGR01459 family)
MTQIIENLSQISARYDAVLCDLWGVLHNGKAAYPEAVDALQAFREKGGTVVLITNAPRPRSGVIAQLERLGAPKDCYDIVVTSGDASQAAVAAGLFGSRIYHVGPERDLLFFEDFDGKALEVERVALDQAESIICTGLWDDQTETPEDYRELIANGINRSLPMLCANPDITVDVGDKRIYCGGAIGQAYAQAGGTTHYFGKPHAPIYDMCRSLLTAHRGEIVEESRILAIGDGILTDVPGAVGEGLDCLFVSGGLADEETGTFGGQPDPEKLKSYLDAAALSPTHTIGRLR